MGQWVSPLPLSLRTYTSISGSGRRSTVDRLPPICRHHLGHDRQRYFLGVIGPDSQTDRRVDTGQLSLTITLGG